MTIHFESEGTLASIYVNLSFKTKILGVGVRGGWQDGGKVGGGARF